MKTSICKFRWLLLLTVLMIGSIVTALPVQEKTNKKCAGKCVERECAKKENCDTLKCRTAGNCVKFKSKCNPGCMEKGK